MTGLSKARLVSVVLSCGVLAAIGLSLVIPRLPRPFLTFPDIGTASVLPGRTLKLYSGQTLGQSFVANFPSLFRIGLLMAQREGAPLGDLVFHLKASPDSPSDLVTVRIRRGDVRPTAYESYRMLPHRSSSRGFFYAITFPPIADSEGRAFYFALEAPGLPEGEAIPIGYVENGFYRGLTRGALYINHQPASGHLAFTTHCAWTGTPAQAGRVILDRLRQDPSFLLFYSVLLAGLLWGMVRVGTQLGAVKARGERESDTP